MAGVLSPPEQRVTLHNVSWETYERLLADLRDSSAPRMTYDRGTLEIMSPSSEYERYSRAVAQIVEELAVEPESLHRLQSSSAPVIYSPGTIHLRENKGKQ